MGKHGDIIVDIPQINETKKSLKLRYLVNLRILTAILQIFPLSREWNFNSQKPSFNIYIHYIESVH